MPIKNITRLEDRAGAAAVRQKAEQLTQKREALHKQLSENAEDWKKVISAAELFGASITIPQDLEPRPPDLVKAGGEWVQASIFDGNSEQSIREIVIEHLKAAGDQGVKAASLRRIAENKLGRTLHYKTIGMTLYRLSERTPPLARREGFVWFYVPQKEG